MVCLPQILLDIFVFSKVAISLVGKLVSVFLWLKIILTQPEQLRACQSRVYIERIQTSHKV